MLINFFVSWMFTSEEKLMNGKIGIPRIFLKCAEFYEQVNEMNKVACMRATKEQIRMGGPAFRNRAVQNAMAMTYIYLMINSREKSEECYRQAIFESIPTDVEGCYPVEITGEKNCLASDMVFKFFKFYDILLCKRDGRLPCEQMYTKYKKMFVNLSAGTVDALEYPIRAELPKSKAL